MDIIVYLYFFNVDDRIACSNKVDLSLSFRWARHRGAANRSQGHQDDKQLQVTSMKITEFRGLKIKKNPSTDLLYLGQ